MHIIRNNTPHKHFSDMKIGQFAVISDPACMHNGHTVVRALEGIVSLTDSHHVWTLEEVHGELKNYAVRILSKGTTLTIEVGA